MSHASESDRTAEIAIIGMAARFPGANSMAEFWQNLREGVESISFFSAEELADSGDTPAMLSAANYVKARAILEGVELFDASFFGISPRDAEIMDPQHRFFLETAWEALEDAGYDPETYKGSIGVYAGSNFSSYMFNLYSNLNIIKLVGQFRVLIANDKDYLATLASYKLDLRGPSINVQTACSTSLVAVHSACQSLLRGECDLALAGGVAINVPQKAGYVYEEGGIQSPDGHCRAFDEKAQGAVAGNGVGVVVLKRLAEALTDGDAIQAIIKASAINNDGALKVGYTAPSVDGQAEVISEAIAMAGIDAESITYVEAHGTATPLGDPIEVAALTKAFRSHSSKEGFCGLGSVKTNIGHLDAAAGVAALIKTVLALKHKEIPPSLHFQQPNPQIDFASSPFYVNKKLTEWSTSQLPRRAGVSSFGLGGTNAHAILEEAPEREKPGPSKPYQLLLLSGKTSTALEAITRNLAEHIRRHEDVELADQAYTLQVGRKRFGYRRMLVCRNRQDAVKALESIDPERVFTSYHDGGYRPVVFMFPGQGSQRVSMGLDLYESEKTYREQVDRCSEILKPLLGLDIRKILYAEQQSIEAAGKKLNETYITQPALFVVEYALARLWMEWGVRPEGMIGHSIGEYVAACLAEVMSLADALKLVAARGRIMQELGRGKMLAIGLPEKEIEPMLSKDLSLAAVNAPTLCVVSGSQEAVEPLELQLSQKKVFCRQLQTSHAFHSHLMQPILGAFAEEVKKVKLRAPKIRYISNVSGKWIKNEEATSADYWVTHIRRTVRFSEGIDEVMRLNEPVLLEVGPGQELQKIVRLRDEKAWKLNVFSSLNNGSGQVAEIENLLNVLGKVWLAGVEVDWGGFYARERRLRVPMPTYPFERQRYWLESRRTQQSLHENEGRKDASVHSQLLSNDEDTSLAMERLMEQQLHIMSKQLELLCNPDNVS